MKAHRCTLGLLAVALLLAAVSPAVHSTACADEGTTEKQVDIPARRKAVQGEVFATQSSFRWEADIVERHRGTTAKRYAAGAELVSASRWTALDVGEEATRWQVDYGDVRSTTWFDEERDDRDGPTSGKTYTLTIPGDGSRVHRTDGKAPSDAELAMLLGPDGGDATSLLDLLTPSVELGDLQVFERDALSAFAMGGLSLDHVELEPLRLAGSKQAPQLELSARVVLIDRRGDVLTVKHDYRGTLRFDVETRRALEVSLTGSVELHGVSGTVEVRGSGRGAMLFQQL